MGVCCVCNSVNSSKVSLFSFPRDNARREEWYRLLGLQSETLNENPRLCSNHFSRNQFINIARTHLKKDAVPKSLCLKKNTLAQLLGGDTSVTLNIQSGPSITGTSSNTATAKTIASSMQRKLVPIAPAGRIPLQQVTFLPFTPLMPIPLPSRFGTSATATTNVTNPPKRLVEIRPKGVLLPVTVLTSSTANNNVQHFPRGGNHSWTSGYSNVQPPEQVPITISDDEEDEEKPSLLPPYEDRDPLAPDSPTDVNPHSPYAPLTPNRLLRMKQRISDGLDTHSTNEIDYEPTEILPTFNHVPKNSLHRPRRLTPCTKQRVTRLKGESDPLLERALSQVTPTEEALLLSPVPIPVMRQQAFPRVIRNTEQPGAVRTDISNARNTPLLITLPEEVSSRIEEIQKNTIDTRRQFSKTKEIHPKTQNRIPIPPRIIPMEPPLTPSPTMTPPPPQKSARAHMTSLFPSNETIFLTSSDNNMLLGANASETQLGQKDIVIEIQRKALEIFKTDLGAKSREIERLSLRLSETTRKLKSSRVAVSRQRQRMDNDVGKILRKTVKGSRILRELISSQYLRYNRGNVGSLASFTENEKEVALKLFDLFDSTGYKKLLDVGFLLPGIKFMKRLTNNPRAEVGGAEGKCGSSDERIGTPPQNSPPNRIEKIRRAQSRKLHTCTYRGCEYKTTKKQLLISHTRKHRTTDGEFTCRDCQKSFRSSTSFILHRRRCEKRKNNEIQVCPGSSCHFTTYDQSSFKSHLESCNQSRHSLFRQHKTTMRHFRREIVMTT